MLMQWAYLQRWYVAVHALAEQSRNTDFSHVLVFY